MPADTSSVLHTFLKWLRSSDEVELAKHMPGLSTLRHERWLETPVRHLIFDNVFMETYADELRGAFAEELSRNETNVSTFHKMPKYDAYAFTPRPTLSGPFRIFYSRDWYNFWKRLSGIALDENVMTTLHHHKKESESGYIHTDYGIHSFRRAPSENELNHWYFNSIYQTHTKAEKEAFQQQKNVIFTQRALVIIYYLTEEEWREGDGGETGFFSGNTYDTLVKEIEPRPNRLLAFMIDKKSYHAFMKNHRLERNNIIQWFHEPREQMEKRLGIFSP